MLLGLGALAGSAEVAVAGLTVWTMLMVLYLRFYPAAILVWRRGLELVWTLERPDGDGAFYVGRVARLKLSLRNLSNRPLGVGSLRVVASTTLAVDEPERVELGPAREVSVEARVIPRQAGTWHLHGAALTMADPLGLFSLEAYFPSARAFQVLPRPTTRLLPSSARPTGGAHYERVGPHTARLRGLGGDVRELREHVPGDPFKQIAWKATARVGRLMVRDLETSTPLTHHLLVDLGSSMRTGEPGLTKLDAAIELAAAYAAQSLAAGDRVGLVTYDGRIHSEIRPNDGPAHRHRLLEPLLAAVHAVDEDQTELTDSELVAAVGRYLLHQEGVDTRLLHAPALDDPRWAHLAASPSGELYDLRVIFRAVTAAVAHVRLAPVTASTSDLSRLRQFCRLRGIELPPRRTSEAGRRARGLGQALERVASGRGVQRIVVVSDLEGLELGFEDVSRAVRLSRRRGHQLLCAAPTARLFGGAAPADDSLVAEVVFWDEQRREQKAWQRLGAVGVRVIPVGPVGAPSPRLSRPAA